MTIISAMSTMYEPKVLKSCQTAFGKFDFAYLETIGYQAGLVVLTSVRVMPANCFSRVSSSVGCLIILESRPSFCARMKSPSCVLMVSYPDEDGSVVIIGWVARSSAFFVALSVLAGIVGVVREDFFFLS
jgi:hypothetical protein